MDTGYNGMVVSSIGNRLGNQMCCIAAGLSFAKRHKKKFKITTPYKYNLNNSSYTEYEWINNKFEKINEEDTKGFTEIKETKSQEIIDLESYGGYENVIFFGVFNSDKYYDYDLVKSYFGNTEDDDKRIRDEYGDLTDVVSLSVRRGDFLTMSSTFVVPGKEWYHKCYEDHFKGKDILITGDDIDWAKKNLQFNNINVRFLNVPDAVETLKIKSCCKNHIIPPSSYSWWSAYLSGKESKVVCPDLWFKTASGINSKNKIADNWIEEKLI